MKTAIAYVSDIILGNTGDMITRQAQKDAIAAYAKEQGIEIKAWFEDQMYSEDLLMRPGIQELLACDVKVDLLLVERVWSLGRSMPLLDPLFKELERRGLRLEAAAYRWDCVSQMCRRRFAPSSAAPAEARPVVRVVASKPVKVRPPEKLIFTRLARHAQVA